MFPSGSTGTVAVYHGTNLFHARIIQHNGIWLHVQRKHTDFSTGFYVTASRKQAVNWAKERASEPRIQDNMLNQLKINALQYYNHPDTKIPVYLLHQLDLKRLRLLTGKVFPLPHHRDWPRHEASWRSFVQRCRQGIPHSYDFVYGPVAGRHAHMTELIIPTFDKDQLALTSRRSLACLSGLKVIRVK